ncbi:MAG: hypothetical protein GYB65_11890 [Chloroflexi bacterium]|nr:hypothetical protein [Chloroflexota bacterium]
MERPPKDSPYQLIVEGPDDLFFFGEFQTQLLKAGLIPDRAYITELGGKDQTLELRKFLSGLIPRSKPVLGIGLIRDADHDPAATFTSVQSVLRQVDGLSVPTVIGKFKVDAARNLRVGVLIIPPDRPGIRETVCLDALAEHPIGPCVDAFVDCVSETGSIPYFENKPDYFKDKGRLLAYLAAQEHTDYRIGIALARGFIPWDHTAFDSFVRFFQGLTAGRGV